MRAGPGAHQWIVGKGGSSRVASAGSYAVDAHRHHRGPFGAAGALVCALVESNKAAAIEAATPRLVTLLSVAPELRDLLRVPPEVERSFAFPREGNRRSWSLRIAHGVADFILACLDGAHPRPTIRFHCVDHADPLDLELIGVLLRRADPDRLRICLTSTSDRVEALLPYVAAGRIRIARRRERAAAFPRSTSDDLRQLAAAYVDGDLADDDSLARNAYAALDPEERRALHRARVAALESSGGDGARLGAIPLHHECAGSGPAALAAASDRCMHFAWYEAAIDWAARAERLCDPLADAATIARMIRNRLFALLLLDRHDEADALCTQCLAESGDPALLSHACYAQAILHARLHAAPRRDLAAARGWIERALDYTRRLLPSEVRSTNIAFLHNTLALVEMRRGRPAVALALLSDAIATLAREAPASFAIESIILFHNRARLQRADGDAAAAIADLTTLLELEPSNAEALFDRALIHQNAGRHADAIRDYDAAIRWSPPHVETLLNRARALAALGRIDETLAGYDRLLDIDPENVPGLIERACIRLDRDRPTAREDVERGLRIDPANARLLCLRGLIELGEGMADAAHASMTAAIAADTTLADAWANRAAAARRLGRDGDALSDLDQALALRDDPVIHRNRARLLAARQERERSPS